MNAVEKVFALLERAENAEFFCRHFKEDRDRALTERDAAMADLSKAKDLNAHLLVQIDDQKGIWVVARAEEQERLCRLFTTGSFMIRKFSPSSTESVSLTTESALRDNWHRG